VIMRLPHTRWNRICAAALLLACTLVASAAENEVDETTRAFLAHVSKSATIDAKTKSFIERTWADRVSEDDTDGFIVEALAVLSEPFRNGLDSYEDDDYEQAFKTMDALAIDADPYVAANAAVYAVKALIELDRLDQAARRLEAFQADPTAVDLYTRYADEMAYARGYVALQSLDYDRATAAFQLLLDRYPDASARLRVSATQILTELRSRVPDGIGDVADLMVLAGRRLRHAETGDPVQKRQQRAIELLEQLIKEAEQQEQSGGGGGGSSSGDSKGGKDAPSSPMEDSQLPGGGGGGEYLRSRKTAKPGDAWGAMPPAQRDKILQSLRDSFPSRYRQLVEQYFQELSKKP
jgi:tetratricopeptide (TPR) repeat protein